MSIFETAPRVVAPPECLNCGGEGAALCLGCSTKYLPEFGERCWRCNKLIQNSKTCSSCYHTGSLGHVWIATNYEALAAELLKAYKLAINER